MSAWAVSSQYGSVALGPVQSEVYALALDLTAHGRRPYVTLRDLSERLGRPVSSVATALGRLRALGLLGVAARLGRTGGHRLWRLGSARQPNGAAPSLARHSRVVARIMGMWRVAFASHGRRATPDQPKVWDSPSSWDEAMTRHGFVKWWEAPNAEDPDRQPVENGASDTDIQPVRPRTDPAALVSRPADR